MTKVLYVLPREDYFRFGNNGRVSHATGFISGLLENNSRVTVISGDGLFGLFDHFKEEKNLTYLPIWETGGSSFASILGVWRTLKYIVTNSRNYDVITIRYSAKLGWLFTLLLCILRISNWGFEINSLVAHNISSPMLIKISKWLESTFIRLAPFCNVVSAKIKQDIGGRDNVLVLPNGGPKSYLGSLVQIDDTDASINLYYFGKVKSYYDFDMLLELLKRRSDICLNIVGEKSSFLESLENIRYQGEYKDITSLLKEMKFSKYSMLILPFREGIAAEIGSPTKLYEMISMGLPILYRPNVGQLKDTLGERRIGWYYSSTEELEKIINGLVTKDGGNLDKTISEQEYYDQFTWTSRCKSYLEFVKHYIPSQC